MRRRVASLVTLFVLLLIGRPVFAEKVAILAPYADSGVAADLVELTLWLIADWFKERGVDRLMPVTAESESPNDLEQCRQADCAPDYLKTLSEADYAVVTTLVAGGSAKSATEIKIELVDKQGQRYEQTWPVSEAVEVSIDAALTHVFTAFLGSQSDLPNQAESSARVERAPVRAPLAEPRSTSSDAHVKFDPYLDKPATEASVWNYIVGGCLLAGSVPLIVVPVWMAIKDGDVSATDEYGNHKYYEFGTQSILLLSAGGALAVAGTIFILFTPITVESELSIGDGQGLFQFRARF